MTPEQLWTAIAADDTAKGFADVGNQSACADRMTAILPHVSVPTRMTYLGMAAALDADVCTRIITTIDAIAASSPLVAEIQRFLRGAGDGQGVDVGNVKTQAMLTSFVGTVPSGITQADVDKVAALALQPQTITVGDVMAAMDWHRSNS